jgi:hypothetical protein
MDECKPRVVGHAAGAVALYLQGLPDARAPQVKAALLRAATAGKVSGEFLPNTVNLLMYVPPEGWSGLANVARHVIVIQHIWETRFPTKTS